MKFLKHPKFQAVAILCFFAIPVFRQSAPTGKKVKPSSPAGSMGKKSGPMALPVHTQDIAQVVANDTLQMIKIFKNLHANPELGFMETRTAGIVAKALKSLGAEAMVNDCLPCLHPKP